MVSDRQVHSLRTCVVACALAMSLLGCQSKGAVSDALDPAAIQAPNQPAAVAVANASMATQSLGTGPTKVAMLLPLSASGSAGENGRKMLDAAKLAMTDLGNPLLTLTVEDTKGDETYSQQLAVT
ncbi:MAG: ABC transporter substrate-binding protein, partial [Mesorhizobium sp.]